MSVPDIRVGNVGTIFEFTIVDQAQVVVDLSSSTLLEIRFQKPDRTLVTKTAVYTTDGTDGKMRYTSIAADLDTAGGWLRQARVTITAGDFWSTVVPFPVKESLV